MNLPKVVIVGRPNVGKSSLFNRIVGRKAAVVLDREGVTRDRHYQTSEWNGVYFQIIDTGGFLSKELDALDGQVKNQIEAALTEAECAIFVVDGRSGVSDLDLQFSRFMHQRNRRTFLAVNKTESRQAQTDAHEFWSIGMGQPYSISALTGLGVADLLDDVIASLGDKPDTAPPDTSIRVAVLGRPNAGKSTLVNRLLGEERLITSDIPGTTRDSIDTEFEYQGHSFVLTDTAGLRRKARVKDDVEYYSNMRSLESIRRSDVCVLLFDIERGLEIQDLRIIEQVQTAGKGLVMALNKWDLIAAEDKTFDNMVKEMIYKYTELEFVPFIAISGLTGRRLPRLMDIILRVHGGLERILGREEVIKWFEETVAKHPHPYTTKGAVMLKRCCQVMVKPPALAFEVSRPELVSESYIRYLRRQAHEYFGLEGVPLRIWFRDRFQLRTDEELEAYLRLKNPPDDEWTEETIPSED